MNMFKYEKYVCTYSFSRCVHTHTHTYTHIYIHAYVYIHVCIFLCTNNMYVRMSFSDDPCPLVMKYRFRHTYIHICIAMKCMYACA